jgi:hypothetical protein
MALYSGRSQVYESLVLATEATAKFRDTLTGRRETVWLTRW